MIALPGHRVNEGLGELRSTLPVVDGIDLASTVQRIAGWGGSPELYVHFLAGAVAAARGASTEVLRSLGVIAGWRSGVVDLREDALARIHAVPVEAASAAVGTAALSETGRRWSWPGVSGELASIGGFSGFGGAFTAPPTAARMVAEGEAEIETGDELWSLRLDVLGSRLARREAGPRPGIASPVTLSVSPDSYLVRVSA